MSSNHIAGSTGRRSVAGALAAVAVASLVSTLDAQRVNSSAPNQGQHFYADDPIWRDDDTRDVPPVAKFELSDSYELLNETFGRSARSFGPALNVNTLGEVPDSSWFTNRIGRNQMTLDELVRGPNQVDGPAAGTWLVTGRPGAGITPKFTIRDARGDTYLIKLDPADFPELASSVEVISTKLFHAIGYNVPEDFIVTFDPSRLEVSPGAHVRAPNGDKRPLTDADVQRWLANTPRTADGRIRALASRFVPGKVVGQFRYTGTRPDDPNDIYPHERRRELRGMRVFAAWLNHDDARSLNSIDAYVNEGGRRFIRHYLQDFGSNLGSGSTAAQQPRAGNEYLIERDKIAKGLLSFGLWTREWTKVRYPNHPSVGNIEADFFNPAEWKTEYPQPAFDQMDAVDAFWAASIAARFTDEMIEAVVATGELSDPGAARLLTDIIIKRRNKVVTHWITQTNPIDHFAVTRGTPAATLTFDNAATRLGLVTGVAYEARWHALDNRTGGEHAIGPVVRLASPRIDIPETAWGPADAQGVRYASAAIQTLHPGHPNWASPVRVTVRRRADVMDVVGITRPTADVNH